MQLKLKHKHKPTTDFIPIDDLTTAQQILYECAANEWGNPEEVFYAKVEHLMGLLGCDESKATHIILHAL